MNEKNDLSIIIPVYNVEKYLSICIDSLINKCDLRLEIILVNDGSTDRSGTIADQYAKRDSRIKVIHQVNGGASVARNAGLELAQGEYIAFVDSDDWVKEGALSELFNEAIKHKADIAMGKVLFRHKDRIDNGGFKPFPDEIVHVPLSGKDCFIRLMEANAYQPMVFSYIFRKEYLKTIQVRFEEGIMHEDELWTPMVLCQAGKMVVAGNDFYYYRQQDDSVMQTTNLQRRLNSLFRVTDRLMEFADHFKFSDDDGELKNWLYVIIFNLYSWAFVLLARMKDTSYKVPAHHLDRFWRDCPEMMPKPQKLCNYTFRKSEDELKKYTDWRTSEWVAPVASKLKTGKKLMLIYNTVWNEELSVKEGDIPDDWIITTDRKYFQQADVVVFLLPDLYVEVEYDIEKPEKQVWVGWYFESEKNNLLILDPEFRELFDLWMNYKQGADVVYPYYRYEYLDWFKRKVTVERQNKACILINPNSADKTNYNDYLKELMNHIEIDLYTHDPYSSDSRIENKIDIYRNYKFVIAFENAIDPDYVTEKFYDPLIAGSVPIYLGAPNIEEFAPGDHCFVDVRDFESPQSLACFINKCYNDKQLYSKFFEWKNQPLRSSFLRKAEIQKENPWVRLIRKIMEKLSENK